tara:strand:+ start:384 stop:638 length:255 start_codon:yes stop_codon:yes gene_type:complete
MTISEAIKKSKEIYIGFHTVKGYVQFKSSAKQLKKACQKIGYSVRVLNKSKSNPNPAAEWELGHNDILIVDFLERKYVYRNPSK